MKKQIFNLLKGFFFVLFWTSSVCLFAQGVSVKGRVTDITDVPLTGVSIRVEGTTIGTVTDLDGNFILQNVPSNSNIEVSYVGMTTQVIPLNGRTSLNIILEDDTALLEELVVILF